MIEISICPNAGSERPKVREEQRRNSIRHGHHHYLSDGAMMPQPAHLHSNMTNMTAVPVGSVPGGDGGGGMNQTIDSTSTNTPSILCP